MHAMLIHHPKTTGGRRGRRRFRCVVSPTSGSPRITKPRVPRFSDWRNALGKGISGSLRAPSTLFRVEGVRKALLVEPSAVDHGVKGIVDVLDVDGSLEPGDKARHWQKSVNLLVLIERSRVNV